MIFFTIKGNDSTIMGQPKRNMTQLRDKGNAIFFFSHLLVINVFMFVGVVAQGTSV